MEPAADVIRVGADGTTAAGKTITGGFRRAEVTLTILKPESARLLALGKLPMEEVIKRFGQTYVRQTLFF